MFPYADILNHKYQKSSTRPHMTNHDRAAQFAPFAALTGYGEAINETARLTDSRPSLSAEETDELNRIVSLILDRIDTRPELEITYFLPDEYKEGGSLEKYRGKIRRIDEVLRRMIFSDGFSLSVDDIYGITILSL